MARFFSIKTSLAAVSAAVLLAACGSGSSSGASNLVISGTAATGAPIANGAVTVSCFEGSGTATTLANGTYSVTIVNGSGPCLVKVVSGTNTYYSFTGNDDNPAVVNVNPITNAIVESMAASLGVATPEGLVAPSANTPPSLGYVEAVATQVFNQIVTALQTANPALAGQFDDLSPLALFNDTSFVAGAGGTGSVYDTVLEEFVTGGVLDADLQQDIETAVDNVPEQGTGSW